VWLAKEPPAAARVGVLRSDFAEPLWGVARFESYAQRTRAGELTRFWKSMSDIMLAKAAESLALRKAFPLELAGLYSDDEMAQSEHAPSAEPVNTRAQLDQFAGIAEEASPDIVDADTGEVLDAEHVHAAARAAALRGTEILRAHLRGVSPEARELLREAVGTGEEPGPLLIAARLADADSIRERLRMATTESPDGPPSERPPPRPAAAPGPSRAWPEPSGETAPTEPVQN
jgi:plasmid stability protein